LPLPDGNTYGFVSEPNTLQGDILPVPEFRWITMNTNIYLIQVNLHKYPILKWQTSF
jgi:hypothetical protein